MKRKYVARPVLASKKAVKASYSDRIVDLESILWDIADKYNRSEPVSGDWDAETIHEMNAISDALNVSSGSAKALMIHELGFSEDDFVIASELPSRAKRYLKAATNDQELVYDLRDALDKVTDKYNAASIPVSGDWETETDHEIETIARAFNITEDSAKCLMINELGWDESFF